MPWLVSLEQNVHVAPHTGAWIEMIRCTLDALAVRFSHPTRVRGLKYQWLVVAYQSAPKNLVN